MRKRLRAHEEEILRLRGPIHMIMNNATDYLVREHIGMRCLILNQMFELHVTEAEIRRFEEVNERLFRLTQDYNRWHLQLQKQMSEIHGLDSEPFELQTTLNYHHDPDSLHPMEEDIFYGSRWNEMLQIISDVEIIVAGWCCGQDICDLDDGTTWAEGPLLIPQFEHICICHLVHALCTHQNYSIPDLLRMTTYCYDYQLNCSVDVVPTKI